MASFGKLYFTPTSCGAASWIAASQTGLKFDSEIVDLASHKTASGADFYTINVKGNVPTLVLPGGQVLNEGSAILQYIADQAPNSNLAPKNGTIERYQLQNTLNWIGTELHKTVGGLFNPAYDQKARDIITANVYKKLDYLEQNDLKDGRKFIQGGNHFTIADSYLYIVLTWFAYLKLTLDNHPKVKAYFEGIKSLPFVVAAHEKMNAAAGAAKH